MNGFERMRDCCGLARGCFGNFDRESGCRARSLPRHKEAEGGGRRRLAAELLNGGRELDGFDVGVPKGMGERLGVQVQFATPGWEASTQANGRGIETLPWVR
ncbi:hypothetical protein [Bradyrhizobium niftali]|uniref:hypothetical protein n=1 Tax=Bradyrhizobium niftali TaxID=2560055 RepID=UPI001F2897CD|nr:hypothetical protein [Bradyrhizobium niftali]